MLSYSANELRNSNNIRCLRGCWLRWTLAKSGLYVQAKDAYSAKIVEKNRFLPPPLTNVKSSIFNDSQNIIQSKISKTSDDDEKEETNPPNKDIEKKNINNSINDFEIDSDKENFLNILSGLAQ